MKKLMINFGLLITAVLTIFTGLLIQIEYHIGNHGVKSLDISEIGIDYSGWSYFHKLSIIFLSILFVVHIGFHRKWYKTVIRKRLFIKNKQVVTLTIIFVLVAITGYVPWIIDLFDGKELMRYRFIEIHDKIAIVLLLYFILHIMKRLKWFLTTIEKMNKNHAR